MIVENGRNASTSERKPFSNAILGLRGFAVFIVVLSHYPISQFKNGFIGVDIFFVISGFLISRQLLLEYHESTIFHGKIGFISLRNFFIRRFARIVPSLLACLIIINFATYFFSNQIKFHSTLLDSARASIFALNIHFIQSSYQYFDHSSLTSMLMPLWSLSVEEQFYILWPIAFLWVLSFHGLEVFQKRIRWYTRLILFTSTLIALSFFLAILTFRQNPNASYFATTSRIWEFGLGGFASIYQFSGKLFFLPKIPKSSNFGLILLLLSTLAIDTTNFFITLIPVALGTCFILLDASEGEYSIANAVLSTRYLMFLGRISFPLYLLHFAVLRIAESSGVKQTIFTVSCEFSFSVLLAWIINQMIELPFQRKINGLQRNDASNPGIRSRKKMKRITGIVLALVFSGITVLNIPGVAAKAQRVIFHSELGDSASRKTIDQTSNSLSIAKMDQNSNSPSQLQVDGGVKLIPKSRKNSSAISNPVDAQFSKLVQSGVSLKFAEPELLDKISSLKNVRNQIWSACLSGSSDSSYCSREGSGNRPLAFLIGDSIALSWYPALNGALPSNWKIQTFTLGECEFARVTPLKNGSQYDACNANRKFVDSKISQSHPDLIVISSSWATSFIGGSAAWSEGFTSRMNFLKGSGSKVLLIGSTPGAGIWSDCLKGNDISKCNGSASTGEKRRIEESAKSKEFGFAFLDPSIFLCFAGVCPSTIGGIPTYWDGSHLNSDFSLTLSHFLRDAIERNYPKFLSNN